MQIFDTHCHIHEAEVALLSDEPEPMWARAKNPDARAMLDYAQAQGVSRLLCVGTSAADSQRAVDFAQKYQQCWAAVGLHPHEAKDAASALPKIGELARQPKVVAIGEIGLDYFYEHSSRQQQIDALHLQIQMALQNNLPISFHVREAYDDFWQVFDEYQNIRGVLHSFTDSPENCQKALERGLLIGINGIITFTKNDWQLQIAKELPLDKILLETDAPYLTPRPLRGTINEPANVRLVGEFLAELRNDSLQNIVDHTTQNAIGLFGLK